MKKSQDFLIIDIKDIYLKFYFFSSLRKIKNSTKMKKSENLPNLFYKFLIKNKILFSKNLIIFFNCGIKNTILYRNTITLFKTLKLINKVKIFQFNYFDIFQLLRNQNIDCHCLLNIGKEFLYQKNNNKIKLLKHEAVNTLRLNGHVYSNVDLKNTKIKKKPLIFPFNEMQNLIKKSSKRKKPILIFN
tara:strand:- start:60094 stop:60657 length:564 start_codon:yes stop_codon:yes gene_type:complete